MKGTCDKERYVHLNAEFQRKARRDKKSFLSDQCKEIEENNRMGKTRDSSRKLEIPKEHFKPIFTRNAPLVSLIFLKRSLVFHSVVFLYFFALIAEEGFLISSCFSLELCIQMLISSLFSFAFLFSSFHSYM